MLYSVYGFSHTARFHAWSHCLHFMGLRRGTMARLYTTSRRSILGLFIVIHALNGSFPLLCSLHSSPFTALLIRRLSRLISNFARTMDKSRRVGRALSSGRPWRAFNDYHWIANSRHYQSIIPGHKACDSADGVPIFHPWTFRFFRHAASRVTEHG